MTIDENTGLPELPEGYFWRVAHPINPSSAYWTSYSLDTTKLQVALMEHRPDKKVADKRNKLIQRLIPHKTTWEPQNPLLKYEVVCKGTSSQAIINAAYKILKRKRKDEALTSKLGDYPPKKLEK